MKRHTETSITPLIILTVVTALAAGVGIVVLIAGAPSAALPTLQFASIKLSNEAVAARQQIKYPVRNPNSPVVLIYATSFCTAELQSPDPNYIYNVPSTPTNNSLQAIDYGTLQCYNQSIGFSYNFAYEFDMNYTCVRKCAEKFRNRTARVSRQYLAALILTLVLFIYEIELLATAHYVSRWFRCLHVVLSATVTGLVIGAMSFGSTKSLKNGFRHCFGPRVDIGEHGTGGLVLTIAGVVLVIYMVGASFYMLAMTDGRRTLPYRYRKTSGDGCGDGSSGGGDGGGGGGGGDGGC